MYNLVAIIIKVVVMQQEDVFLQLEYQCNKPSLKLKKCVKLSKLLKDISKP